MEMEKPISHIDVTDEIPEELTGLTQETNSTYRNTDNEMICGLGPCAPNWLQKFASKQSFLVVFCITWVLQGMYHTYFVSAITTIEKLFQIQSKITGIIMSATEIGQIGSSLLLTYYGGQGHRPKWIAWGMVLFAVSSFTCSLPHFIYGRHLINANELTGIVKDPNICKAKSTPSTPFLELSNVTNITRVDNFTKYDPEDCYEEVITSGYRLAPSVTNIVLAIFFISLLGVGMGQTAVYTLGIPYIDDNVASKESPLYFGKLFLCRYVRLSKLVNYVHQNTVAKKSGI
uniref:Solute carrier organic anion transporter family member 4A1-like n=1 Tax=Diabrotica virgifera virgifera TaxID=50390 RepID=A0A6P7HI54_DIAVI